MSKLLLFLAFLSLAILAIGTAFMPNSQVFLLASPGNAYECVREVLASILFLQLVTRPPRNIVFRIIAGISALAVAAWGVKQTGRIITSAALLLLVVIGSFAVGRVVSMKEVAIGLVIAVLVDVFFVRLLLVPASMKLLGRYNWWLPGALEKLYRKFRLHID